MRYDEKWSYTYDEIEEYLLSCGAIRKSTGNPDALIVADPGAHPEPIIDSDEYYEFEMPDCKVILVPMPERPFGHFTFPQTRLMIDGPGSEVFYRGFLLNFLTGGG